jgi:hypothetical protein
MHGRIDLGEKRRCRCVLAVLLGITAVPKVVRSEDADALVKKGLELRRQGHDREALAEFQHALELQKVPRIVAQLALAEQAVGLWVKADEHMAEALAHGEDPWIGKNRTTLETSWRIVKSHVGSVDVWGTPDGAEVLLDGQVVGTLPMSHPARVAETQVTLQVRAPGSVEITRVLPVRLGDLIREHVDLRPLPSRSLALGSKALSSADSGTTSPEVAASRAMLTTKTTAGGHADPNLQTRPITRRWWFWTGLGALVAAGVGTTVVLSRDRSTNFPTCANAECPRN